MVTSAVTKAFGRKSEKSEVKIKLDYATLLGFCQKIAAERCEASPGFDGITVEEFAGAVSRFQGAVKSQDKLAVLTLSRLH